MLKRFRTLKVNSEIPKPVPVAWSDVNNGDSQTDDAGLYCHTTKNKICMIDIHTRCKDKSTDCSLIADQSQKLMAEIAV